MIRRDHGRSQKLHVGGPGTACQRRLPAHHTPHPSPSAPAPLGIHTKIYKRFRMYTKIFCASTGNASFFLCSLGGPRPQPLWLRPWTWFQTVLYYVQTCRSTQLYITPICQHCVCTSLHLALCLIKPTPGAAK